MSLDYCHDSCRQAQTVSLSVDTFASWMAWPGADFVQYVIVTTGKAFVAEVGLHNSFSWHSLYSELGGKMTGRHLVNMPRHAVNAADQQLIPVSRFECVSGLSV